MKLTRTTALVTGASRGIGKSIALAFAREGADMVITGRDQLELRSVDDEISSMGRRCLSVELDLSEDHAVERLWSQVSDVFKGVDILVNNAGIGSVAEPGDGGNGDAKSVIEFDDRFWDLTLRVNLTVPYKLSRKALPQMLEQGFGRIIFVASISSFRPGVHDVAYSASKSGLLGLMRTIAREHVKDGITSNAICPGTTVTRTADRRLRYEAQRLGKTFDQVNSGISPLGRRLVPDEVAPIALYLASPEAAAATGQTFVIDGGQLNS